MCHKVMAALLVTVTAGAASAQSTASSGSELNALQSNPATTHATISSSSLTNSVQAGPSIYEQGTYELGPTLGEPVGPSMKPWPSDIMAVDGEVGWSFVVPDGIQAQRDVLFRKLDLLRRAEVHSSPVYFGVDPEIKFVEHHDYQPGIPVPVGFSYWKGQQRLSFFVELAPILDPAPAALLGWGGGVGVRFYLGR